ncbi:pyrimidine/purine nucleosidase domain-containing protein, partial [Rudaea sp.]|uniref:pyrimidine/purine nucleosidase domain-containing protein n=1 Tax=Rudaea sp. TaxID=2136325 RepID=UPI002ED2E93B
MSQPTVNARISPVAGMDVLSRDEVTRLRDASKSGLHGLLRRCALAVLDSGDVATDDARGLLERYPDFDIQVLQQDRGVKLEIKNAPARAFVEGKIIRGINELLFAVVRDIAYVATQMDAGRFHLDTSHGITHAVFEILRNARVLKSNTDPNLVVCWGGHSINRTEYKYTKMVGYDLG